MRDERPSLVVAQKISGLLPTNYVPHKERFSDALSSRQPANCSVTLTSLPPTPAWAFEESRFPLQEIIAL